MYNAVLHPFPKQIKVDDRDYYGNKRLELAGQVKYPCLCLITT